MKKAVKKKAVRKKVSTPEATEGISTPPVGSADVDLRFYTKAYKITTEDKKMLVNLVLKPEFRVFEKYMDWRINAGAHRMKALLMEGKTAEATSEAATIDALVKVTQDLQNFWTEVKLLDIEDDLLIKEKNSKKPTAFGVSRMSIDSIDSDTDLLS